MKKLLTACLTVLTLMAISKVLFAQITVNDPAQAANEAGNVMGNMSDGNAVGNVVMNSDMGMEK
jgi:hypothetical protein